MSWEDAVTAVDTPAARAERARALLRAALAAADVPAAVRELFAHEDLAGFASCAIELEQLRVLPRTGALVGRLERASRAAAKQLFVRIAADSEVPALRAAVDAPEDWPEYPVPAGYEASPRGIYRLEQHGELVAPVLVAESPVAVVGVRVDIGTGNEWLVLGFVRHGTWRRMVVPREIARDSRALVQLSSRGVPVSSVTSRELVRWLTACESASASVLTCEACTARTGWHGEIYICGPGQKIDLEDPRGQKSGWRTSGTWEGWLAAVRVVDEEPVPWLILYAAAAAPLLRWFQAGHCPIIDLSGPWGKGKTTAMRLAASGWGRPDELDGGTITTWQATAVSIERRAARTWDVPLLLDDTRRAQRPEDVTPALYALAQGRGKDRGDLEWMAATPTWRLVTISTGEAPLIEVTGAGGARARVLSITRTPAVSSKQVAKRLEAGICAHYGHLGPRVAARGLALGDELQKRYQQALEAWGLEVPDADTRLLSIAAMIDAAASVVCEVGVPDPSCDWRAELFRSLMVSVAAGDLATRALLLVREDLARFPGSYQGQHDQREPVAGGWRGVNRPTADWVGVFPSVLERLLREAGLDPTPVIGQWVERGVLRVNRGQTFFRTRIDGALTPEMYAIRRSILDADPHIQA